MKFKVGDFIKGKENAEYAITDEKMKKGQILKIEEYFVEIKVLEHLDKNEIGHTYKVTKYNFEECFEILKQFTKSDLKDGDMLTQRDGRKKIVCDNTKSLKGINDDSYLSKDNYNDNLIDKDGDTQFDIIKVERPVKYETVYERKEEILDEAEKRYLRDVIRPFRDRVEYIEKEWCFGNREYIIIAIKDSEELIFPNFKENTKYKNMELEKEYALEELRTMKETK